MKLWFSMLCICVCCILASLRITRSGSWKMDFSFLWWFYHKPEASNLSSLRLGAQGCKDASFSISLYINVCRNIDMYITTTPIAKEKMSCGIARGHGGAGQVEFFDARGMFFPQVLQN
jgi:hypothetical protein